MMASIFSTCLADAAFLYCDSMTLLTQRSYDLVKEKLKFLDENKLLAAILLAKVCICTLQTYIPHLVLEGFPNYV